MAKTPDAKPVTALEPVLLFIGAAAFAMIVLHALVTGWVWIPGSRRGGGTGHWTSRVDDMGDYLTYITIVSLAGIGVFAMAVARLRRFNAQVPSARRR